MVAIAEPIHLTARPPETAVERREAIFQVRDLEVRYGGKPAVREITMDIQTNKVTAIIGPSGCGKSTFIRCFNRMNDLIPGAEVRGELLYHSLDLYGPKVDPVEVRKRIGMVFQKPNPFPKSIFDNVAFGPRVLGLKDDLSGRVERALQQAALWDEVKHRLKAGALSLSGGQQQRLCIARCLAVEPDVILMDEPASALDPIATTRIEDLMQDLKREYAIVTGAARGLGRAMATGLCRAGAHVVFADVDGNGLLDLATIRDNELSFLLERGLEAIKFLLERRSHRH